ncbi:MAG: RHS repeat protein [Acidipropionibacterium sp.]|nr:RHS repeat protein [Acidipropionibacterium sp.]
MTRFDYDALGRQTRIRDAAGACTEREFDAMGRLIGRTDALGRTTTYSYDASGRLVRQIRPGDAELSWTYNAAGLLESESAGGQVLARYDRDFGSRTVRPSASRARRGRRWFIGSPGMLRGT